MEADYGLAYGLWLHLSRIRYQTAEATKLGTEAGNGDGRLPMKWFDGIAALEDEVGPLALNENSKRAERRFTKRMNKPGGMFG